MSRLGLPEAWIDRVMTCVTSPTFSIRINGKAYGNIKPSRGIQQGDPLAPYLFLLCAEGFSSESSNMCINTLERLDPQIQNNQFKLYDKQQVCGK